MSTTRAYRAQRRPTKAERTRERITLTVRELLAEGTFHGSTVEEVAERAGVSRATLYQHFRSRLELVDAICDTLATNPSLVRLRETVTLADPDEALAQTVALAVRFWATEDAVLHELYGVVAVDPAARAFVERQRADRLGEVRRLTRHLRDTGRLRPGLSERDALDGLMVLTSYETYRQLREAGHGVRRLTRFLQDSARTLVF